MTVDCEQAANFISARIDGELAAADEARLDAHLAGCAACRAVLDGAELQDAALVRAFAGGRDVAVALARRVVQDVSEPTTLAAREVASGVGRRSFIHWAGWSAVAAAAGFMVAVILLQPVEPQQQQAGTGVQSQVPAKPQVPVQPLPPVPPIAHLALASGDVFKCPSGGEAWERMTPGTELEPGAKVRTSDAAKCELALPGGSRLRLNSRTELLFATARDLHLAGGQIFSAVPPDADPLRIAAGDAQVTTVGPSAQLDIARGADAATVTVVAGSARVDGQERTTTVRGGQFLRVGTPFYGCEPVIDPVKATRWLEDLLVLLPPDDPELLARVDALLARIVAERRADPAATTPGPVERDVRASGQAWAAPIARYAINHLSAPAEAERDKRRTAARLLADVAPPACVADLIALLADADGEVRFHAAAALNRLTGQTLGFSPEHCGATPRNPAPAAAWQEWWGRNSSRYPARP